MRLVFGGAYQGKAAFAQKQFAIADAQVWRWQAGQMPDFSKTLLCGLEHWVLEMLEQGKDPLAFYQQEKASFLRCTVVMADISSGVVPMEALHRKWREKNGRLLVLLAEDSQEAWRVFCGIGSRIK